MMKVCHIISGDLWAGAEVTVYTLLKQLQIRHELSVIVIVLNDGQLLKKLKRDGFDVHLVDERKKRSIQVLMDIGKIVGKHQPDVLHSHRYKENMIAFLLKSIPKKKKLIATQHGMPESNACSNKLWRWLVTKINYFVLKYFFDTVVVVSKDMRELFVESLGFREQSVTAIHNGIDDFDILNKARKKKHAALTVGSAGRLVPVKNHKLMVEIAEKIHEKIDEIQFRLAGEGPERKMLEALVREKELSDIFSFDGHLNDMTLFYQSLDVYLNTSIHEGIPMSIIEAMSFGLPVIAPGTGGIPEMISHNIDGFLIERCDPEEYAAILLKLYKDSGLKKKISTAARQRARHAFSAEKMAEKYMAVYEKL